MRVTKEKTLENKRRIVETASRLFRQHGYDGIGIADLMREAGFSHGGFYNHFSSKEELIAAASQDAFEELERETRGKDLSEILASYLSPIHRDDLARACPATALGCDAGRQTDGTKRVFKAGIEGWLARIDCALEEEGVDGNERRDKAINLLAKAVGAVVLARAVSIDPALSDEILQICQAGSLADVCSAPK
jgi:TetR/AcrR family transcriptional repressor of nem operon